MPKKTEKTTSENYYSDYSEEKTEPQKTPEFGTKKIAIILIILLAIVVILILAINLFSQKNNLLFFSEDGKTFNQNVTISKDGKLIDSISLQGENLTINANPLEQVRGKISSTSLSGGKKTGKITITGTGGKITILNNGEGFFIDQNGNVIFTVDPSDIIDIDEYYDENTGEYNFPQDLNYQTTFEFIIIDEETGEETIIIAPVDFIFSYTNANQCMALNRAFVNESTHYGSLPVNGKIGVICETSSNLTSSVTWESERAGNVEISVNNGAYYTVLTDYNKPLLSTPLIGEYPFKIIFTPFKEAAGKKAYFSVNFNLNGLTSKIDFEVPVDNLEQCVKISEQELILKKESESVSFDVDVSTCHSDKVTISLCDGDETCSGGTEGGIKLSQYSFILSPKGTSNKTISISRDEIPGIYGIPVYARISGASKILVDEKLVQINPFNNEEVFPEKYNLSMIGAGKDSVTIRNTNLAEDIEVNASICNLYKSSMGVKTGASFSAYDSQNIFGESWWRALSSDREKYAGSGKYQAALFSLIGELETKRAQIQDESYTRNALIKQSYLMTEDVLDKINTASDGTEEMITSLEELNDKLGETNEYADLDLVSQMVGLTTAITTLTTSFLYMSADLAAANGAAISMAGFAKGSCAVALPGSEEAAGFTQTAVDVSTEWGTGLSLAYSITYSAYALYGSVESFTNDIEEINADSALTNTNNALDKLAEAKAEAEVAMTFAELTLVGASIDTFYSISKEDFMAKNYLDDVSTHAQNVLDLLAQAQEYLTDAMDDLTIGLPDTKSNTENIIAITASIAQLLAMFPLMESGIPETMAGLDSALTSTSAAAGLAAEQCTANGAKDPCCLFAGYAKATTAEISATNLAVSKTSQDYYMYVTTVNTVYSLFSTYQQMSNDYTDDYTTASTELSTLIPLINDAKLAAQALVDFLPTSIDAANWLGSNSGRIGDVANYTSEEYGDGEEVYNKKRLNGLVGTALSNAFVNGAYEGGVYSKENSSTGSGFSEKEEIDENKTKLYFSNLNFSNNMQWEEGCDNKVKLTLTDYVINLLADAQKPIVSNNSIVAVWDFSDPKVYDVFEEQTVNMIFSNSGLKRNVYGVLEIPIIKHVHKNPTDVTNKFGPFNVPDAAESLSYKYHMKFNTIPKKSNNYTKFTGDNSCSNGILRGETGNANSAPKIILSWDWNSVGLADSDAIANNSGYSRKINSAVIGTNSNNEPFIDATQLSILLSKKLGSLDYYLETVQTECPSNPVEKIIKEIAPVIESTAAQVYTSEDDSSQKCYLPLSTKEYDGKPALYYYLPKKTSAPEDVFAIESKPDIQKVRDREEFLTLVDFNAFLIRDGYGIDFQSDFVTSYSSKAFNAAYSFMNNETGIKSYFFNIDRFFFSSKANLSTSKKQWVIPDAGKYRVRALIEFDQSARLFLGGSPSAEIIILLDLIEPVNQDYSPWYYTPIDGFTGLMANNNRRGYGASLSGGFDLEIVNSQGAILSSQQKNSLSRINYAQLNDFFLLNALPSMRSKILDYSLSPLIDEGSSIVFTPTVATPLLFEIKEVAGQKSALNYKILRQNSELSSNMNSSLILSKLGDCFDYTGIEGTTFSNNGPDIGDGKVYGELFPTATRDGLNYLKTVVYAPTSNSYFMEKLPSQKVYSPSLTSSAGDAIMLVGVPGMKSNYYQTSELADSLEDIFLGIQSGSICVARLGTREVFFWPEEEMFKSKYVGTEMYSKIQNAQDTCLK